MASDPVPVTTNSGARPEKEWPEPMTMPELSACMQKKPTEDLPTVVLSATQPIQMRVDEHRPHAHC